MPYSTRPMGLAAPLLRSAAFAALLSAPLAAAPMTAAHADPTTGTAIRLAQTATTRTAATAQEKADSVEQRITELHSQLKIAPDQESKWNAVAQAMRDNAANMQKLVAEKRQKAPQNMTALDDLDTYQDFAQQHVDGLKHLTSAFKSLYDSMSDQQKKNTDQVFANFHKAKTPEHG